MIEAEAAPRTRRKNNRKAMQDAILSALAAYEAMDKTDRQAINLAIIRTLDVEPKDWARGMMELAQLCQE